MEAAQQCEHNSAELWAPSPRDLLSWFRGGTCVEQQVMRDQSMTRRTISIPSVRSNTFQILTFQNFIHLSKIGVPRLCHIALRHASPVQIPHALFVHVDLPSIHAHCLRFRGDFGAWVFFYTSEHVILQNEQLENLGNLYSINCSLDGIKTIYLKLCVDLS